METNTEPPVAAIVVSLGPANGDAVPGAAYRPPRRRKRRQTPEPDHDPVSEASADESAKLVAGEDVATPAGGPEESLADSGVADLTTVNWSDLTASPENDELYRPVDPADPEIIALAQSIRQRGLLEPLVITSDGYIVSGHRRHAAAGLAGQAMVPVRRLLLRRADDPDEFLRLLREHNRQREKTNAERLREELVDVSADEAHRELHQFRRAQAAVGVAPLKLGHGTVRHQISPAKWPMLAAIQAIVEDLREFWPLSDRQIHYQLLNDPPLIHASKPNTSYRNDKASYKALTDLATRARLTGEIPFEAIGDETRPVQCWDVHDNSRAFLRRECEGLFRGYYRNLLVSQPNHFELVGEKNTIGSILRPVAADYTMPFTTGRGYCSLPPRREMAERFRRSGKDKLVLLVVSDLDPEGESIAESFAYSMRDDFGVDAIHPIKVALTLDQVERFALPPNMTAKKTSSRYKKYVAKYGKHVYELESLPPETLQQVLRETIEGVIDREALDREIEAERQDAAFLEGVRRTVLHAMEGIDMAGGD